MGKRGRGRGRGSICPVDAVARFPAGGELVGGAVRVVTGECRIGPLKLGDAMVMELAAEGRIQRVGPHLRPWLALTLFALRLGPSKLARHPGVLVRPLRTVSSTAPTWRLGARLFWSGLKASVGRWGGETALGRGCRSSGGSLATAVITVTLPGPGEGVGSRRRSKCAIAVTGGGSGLSSCACEPAGLGE